MEGLDTSRDTVDRIQTQSSKYEDDTGGDRGLFVGVIS